MEQFFLDRRTYVDPDGNCSIPPPIAGPADAFELSCVGKPRSSYVYMATGLAGKGMSGFVYAVNEIGARSTWSLPGGWTRTPDCWTVRLDGTCV